MTGCHNVEVDRTKHNAERGWNGGNATSVGRMESNLIAVDPVTQEIKKNLHLPYPNFSGVLSTGGGLVFVGLMDGTVAAFDDTSLDQLWKINIGSRFLGAAHDLRGQRQAICGDRVGNDPASGKRRRANAPELNEQRNATVLYVFGL